MPWFTTPTQCIDLAELSGAWLVTLPATSTAPAFYAIHVRWRQDGHISAIDAPDAATQQAWFAMIQQALSGQTEGEGKVEGAEGL